MTLGQKIKEARQERGMTQKQLVGDQITRNMLSKIENDSATPSVRTLEYLASRLGLPAGDLLGELRPGMDEIPDGLSLMRSAYREGRYLDCMRLLDEDREACATDEGFLLRARSAAAAAREAMAAFDYEAAKQYADDADYYNKQGIYYAGDLDAEMSLILLECALRLDREEYEENRREYLRAAGALDFRSRYSLAEAAWLHRAGNREAARETLGQVTDPGIVASPAWAYLRGILEEDPRQALAYLREAEKRCDPRDRTLLLKIYAALETAYTAEEDYRMAYRYAALQLHGEE